MSSKLLPYLVAVLCVAVAVVLKVLANEFAPQTDTPFLFLYAAVMISAWYGGLIPGLFSLALSLFASYWFFPANVEVVVPPLRPRGPTHYLQMSMFLVEGVLISVFSGRLHWARLHAEENAAEAERRRQESEETIEQLRYARQTLQDSQSRFRRLVDSNIIGVFFGDLEGNVLDANNAFLAMVGYQRPDLDSGQINTRRLTPPEFLDASTRARDELDQTGQSQPYEIEFICQDGTRIPLMLGSPVGWGKARNRQFRARSDGTQAN